MTIDLLQRSSYHYDLPPELIAQYPLSQRESSRLMVVDRKSGTIQHRQFSDICDYLSAGDVLVINTTKVFPARLYGVKATGARIEILLLHPISTTVGDASNRPEKDDWSCLVKPANRLKIGDHILFSPELSAEYVSRGEAGVRTLRFTSTRDFIQIVNEIGEIPLPHYIKRKPDPADNDRYQTVYATDDGSVAAPTAGLHFTQEILEKIKVKGATIADISLNVGAGTFKPVKTDNITDHQMHAEYCTMPQPTADTINSAHKNGHKVIAVGTTSTRTIESFAIGMPLMMSATSGSKWTDIFIYPSKKIHLVDALLTNFHLPESTLLMLVCAFAGYDLTMQAYQTAINERYRFFSYGDAMLIL